jgi:hypothetical protein
MKTRCERFHHRHIAQLQQCRRCKDAQVRCITTLEAVPHPIGKRERQRKSSGGFDGGYPKRTAVEMEMEIQMPLLTAEGRISEGSEIDFQWHDISQIVHQEATTTQEEQNVNAVDHNAPFTDYLAMPSASITETTPLILPSPEPYNPFWEHALPSLLPPSLSIYDTQTEHKDVTANKTIMTKLTDFNANISNDVQNLTSPHQTPGLTTTLLVKTLHHSSTFLDLLSTLTLPASAPDTCAEPGKVDTDIVLQLLSCNINMKRMYEALRLSLPEILYLSDAQTLKSLLLEGLQTLDAEMQGQVLVHICSLTYVKIQKQLNMMRRRGLLTQTADAMFQVVLGSGSADWSNAIGTDQIVNNFRRLVLGRAEIGLPISVSSIESVTSADESTMEQ